DSSLAGVFANGMVIAATGAGLRGVRLRDWRAGGLRAGTHEQPFQSRLRRIDGLAGGDARLGQRLGFAPDVWAVRRLSQQLAVYSGRPCAVHLAVSGTPSDGGDAAPASADAGRGRRE